MGVNSMMFSIIVPVYNVEKFLNRCLDSIVSQDYQDYEVIIIDDGSTDGCPQICDEYAASYEKIKVIHQLNGGLSKARNVGMENANGEFIIFIDSDDWIDVCSLKSFAEILTHNNVDLLIGKAKTIDDQGNTQDKVVYRTPQGRYAIKNYLDQLKDTQTYTACAPFTIYRRAFLQMNELHFTEGLIHEDEVWTPSVLLSAKSVYVSDVYFYFHYIRMGSINRSTNFDESGRNLFEVVKELQVLLKKQDNNYAQVIRDQMVVLYLQAICLVSDYTAFLIDKKYIKQNSFFMRTRIKSYIYSISPRFYVALHKIYRR
jgi:glycosyltransferase involved in cell wall biosynthesis